MKKYKEYIKRLCALLLVCTLVVSQDLMPVHALTDNTTVTESTENEINATAGENTEATTDGQIEAQTPENSAVEAGNEKGGTVGAEIKENAEQAGNGANLPENNAESTTPSGDDENQVDTAENPAEEETNQDDRLLPEETTEDEIMPADAGTTADQYPEGSIHVNPSYTAKADPLGNTVTVNPGDNKNGDGSLGKPYYSLGKAYEVAVPSEGEPTEKNIYVHSGVIVSGEEGGTDENGTGIVASTGAVKSATYFAEDRKLVVNQADDLDALFTVIGGKLTFQNMTVKMMDEVLAKGAKLRIALSGGTAVLGNGLNVPNDNFYFSVNETVGGTKEETPGVAPIQVDQVPNTDGDKIPVVVSSDLVGKYLKTDGPQVDAETKTTTQKWTVKIPIAKINAEVKNPDDFALKGIGKVGTMTYKPFTEEVDDLNGEGRVTEDSATMLKKEWNTKLSFTLDGDTDTVYLTGYHKTVTQTKSTNEYKGVIYVGGVAEQDAKNDGLSEGTPVGTLNKAKELLDYYDALYKNDYPYPKIDIIRTVYVSGTQSLDFVGYETTADAEFAPSSTGYRASLWVGQEDYGYYMWSDQDYPIHMQEGSILNLGEGVKITDVVLTTKDAGRIAPEKIEASKKTKRGFIRNDNRNVTINLNKVCSSGFSRGGSFIFLNGEDRFNASTNVNIKDCTIKGCGTFIEGDTTKGKQNISIEGRTIVESISGVCSIWGSQRYSETGVNIKIALTGEATVDPTTGKPTGEGYLYSEKEEIISSWCSSSSDGNIDIQSGLLVGNDNLISLHSSSNVYMRSESKYYQNNPEASIICFDRNEYKTDKVYYQGGTIQSMGAAFVTFAVENVYGSYGNYGVIFDGGLPKQENGEKLKIIARTQWNQPHVFLGKGLEGFYNNSDFKGMVEFELYDKDIKIPFKDLSRIVGRMDSGDDLEKVKDLFKLCWDKDGEIYEGKVLMKTQAGDCLVIAPNGIYVDGSPYNEEKHSGGHPYPEANGSLANPVASFWDAQLVYNEAKKDGTAGKLKGIFILNQVAISSGMDVTITGKEGGNAKQTDDNTYVCCFDKLPICDTGLENYMPRYNETIYGPGANDAFTAILVNGGRLTLDQAKMDGSRISDTRDRELFLINNKGQLVINHSTIENMNYITYKGAIRVLGEGSKLNIIDSTLNTMPTSKQVTIGCQDKAECKVENSNIKCTSNSEQDSYGVIDIRSGEMQVKGTEITSEYRAGISYRTARLDLEDSRISSEKKAGLLNDSLGESTINIFGGSITGTKAILVEYKWESTQNAELNLNVERNAVLQSTSGNTVDIRTNNTSNFKVIANIYDSQMTAKNGNAVYFNNVNPASCLTLNASNAGQKVSLKIVDDFDGVVMKTRTSSVPLNLGGNIVINSGENAQDINLEDSYSTIYLRNELNGDPNYTVKTMTNHIGDTVVDCTGVSSNALQNQSKFILCNTSLDYYKELGIEFNQNPHPSVSEDGQKLIIPESPYIFWDWKSGDDNNSEKKGGGHSKKFAVKSPNGVRAVLMKDGYINADGTATLGLKQEPIKVVALSLLSDDISTIYKKMNNWIDPKCYGDTLQEDGKYAVSSENNTADPFNWDMPKPNNGTYLISIMREKNLDSIVLKSYYSELKLKNIQFSDSKTTSLLSAYIRIGYEGSNYKIENCYFDCIHNRGGGNVIHSSSVDANIIKNVKITGNYSTGIYLSGDKETILDQVQITGGSIGVEVYGEEVTIQGNNTSIQCLNIRGSQSKVRFEEGTIKSGENSYISGVSISEGEFYQSGNSQIVSKGDGISGYGKVYLNGGEIIGTAMKGSGVEESSSYYNLKVYLNGTTIRNFQYGIQGEAIVYMTDGKIIENQIGIDGDRRSSSNYIDRVYMSGGSISRNTSHGVLNVPGFNMTGGEICDNNGSGFWCSNIKMKGGSIARNKGSGIYGSKLVTISGGVIEDNKNCGIKQSDGSVLIEGGIIRNNYGEYGSAIYISGDTLLELNGGEIYGNHDSKSGYGEVYAANLKLGKKGTSYPKIKDTIYLTRKDGKIELTAAVRGDYNVRVYEDSSYGFKKGDLIVIPNGDSVQSAASYLTRFTLLSDSYVLARKGKNLVLDGILFVNGTTNTDGNGALPNHPRNNFKTVIEDANYNDNVIYITGAVHIKSGDNVVVNDRTIRRYTGQPLNGRKYDANIYNEPLFIVDKGATLTLINCTVSGRMGAKSDETYSQDTGYLIENYGTLNIDVDSSGSGIAADVEKQTHSVLADNLTGGLGIAQHGTLNISPFSQIDQMVKLGGQNVEDTAVYYGTCASSHSLTQQKSCKDTTDRFINIYGDTAGTGLQKKLNLDVDNKVDGRLVTSYTALDKSASLQTEKTQHQIKDLKASGLYLTSRIPSTVTRAAATTQTVDMILKRPGIYYVDGTNGNDANKGTCPDEALKTLEKAYENLAADAENPEITSRGGIIYIVANVDLTDTITIKEDGDASVMTAGTNTYNTQGDVIIRRYSKPTTQKQGYTTGTNTGTMFTIADAANVSIQGVTIDGHSQKLDSTDDTLAAEGVTNADAIFSVNGKLTLGSGGAVTKNTLVQNNDASGKNGGLIRVERTGNLYFTGDMPKEADLEEGQAAVYGTRLSGGKAAKGNAVYADLGGTTEMKLAHGAKADYPEIDGSIYLTGNKTTVATESDKYSSFVTIADGTAGAITDNRYEFEVQDAYNGRLVVSYPAETTLSAADVKGYTVNGRQGYDVAVNDAEKSQIILKALGAVYIDGVRGVDTNDGTAPKKSVKTLKRAYELLQTKKGGVLYVVNTVTITDAQELTETSYKNYGTTVALTEGTVQIQRYGKPTAYNTSAWIDPNTMDNFNVESNANALFSVSGSGMLDLKNIQMDGHKDAVALTDSLAYKTNAGAIAATAPLIQVNGGKLSLGEGAVLQNNKNTTAPGSTTSTTGNVPGGAVYNSGTMNITGGVVKGNECKGTARSYTTSEAAEIVTVTPDASGIWQAGKMNVNVSDTAKLTWDVDQYIYLAEQNYDSNVTEQADKDAKVSFLNVQALPTDQVLPLDLNRDGVSTGSGSTGSAAGWFAPGRKVVEMSAEGMVTADNFKVNGDSYVGSWLEGTGALTEKLILAERQGTATILELQRGAKDCIVDVIVPIKAEANSTKKINNLSKKAVNISGAVEDAEIDAKKENSVTIKEALSDEKRIKISCSDGK